MGENLGKLDPATVAQWPGNCGLCRPELGIVHVGVLSKDDVQTLGFRVLGF